MASHADGLQRILGPGLAKPEPGQLRAGTEQLPANIRRSLEAVYMGFGGRHPGEGLTAGPWDFVLDGQLYLQLDGPLHFNRYRAVTLETEWARQLPWAAAYRDHCLQHEDGCLENGGREGGQWTSPEAEAMFGPPGEPGNLTGRGSPRWKQRALYDAIRDACGLHADGVRLARISIYDTVAGAGLADALSGKAGLDRDDLLDFIERRAVGRS